MTSFFDKPAHSASTMDRFLGNSEAVREKTLIDRFSGQGGSLRQSSDVERAVGQSQAVHLAGPFDLDATPVSGKSKSFFG